MSYIVSINGSDGSGKTTQIDLLKQNSNKHTFFPPDIAQYGVFPKLPERQAFEWWFYNSTIEEFCTAVYRGIQYRNEEIEKQDKPIAFIDKGLDTFDARILANFLCRGMEEPYIIQKMQTIKKEIGIRDNEDMKIFLLTNPNIDSRLKIAKSRKGTSFGQTYYDRYQRKLNEIIEKQIDYGIYKVVDASGSIEEVNNNIIDVISKGISDRKRLNKEGIEGERGY